MVVGPARISTTSRPPCTTPGIEQTNAHFHPFLERGESVTRSRGQIIPDAEGLKSPAYLAHFEPVGINDFMCM
jgi:hypothetical protein